MLKTNKNIHAYKINTANKERENDKKVETNFYNFINTKNEILLQNEMRRKNSYAQIMKESLRKQINDKNKNSKIENTRKKTDELSSTGLNLPSYNVSKTTACTDCGTKYQKNMLTKTKKIK